MDDTNDARPTICTNCKKRPVSTYGDHGAYCAVCARWIWSCGPHPDDVQDDAE